MNAYRCGHCGKVVKRDSDKRWIASYCTTTGRKVRLWKIDKEA